MADCNYCDAPASYKEDAKSMYMFLKRASIIIEQQRSGERKDVENTLERVQKMIDFSIERCTKVDFDIFVEELDVLY